MQEKYKKTDKLSTNTDRHTSIYSGLFLLANCSKPALGGPSNSSNSSNSHHSDLLIMYTNHLLMRFQKTLTSTLRSLHMISLRRPAHFIRTAASFSSSSSSSSSYYFYFYYYPRLRLPLPISGARVLKAGPTIPFLGSLFSTSAKSEMSDGDSISYPDQRSEGEWRAVLSPGLFFLSSLLLDTADRLTSYLLTQPN